MAAVKEYELANPPSDGIAAVEFAPDSASLLVASWDFTLRLYDPYTNSERYRMKHQAPVLDCCFADGSHAVSASVDRSLRWHDLSAGTSVGLGTHEKAVKCVNYIKSSGAVASASWDATLRTWDPRAPGKETGTYRLPDKAYTMDAVGNRLVVGTAGRHVLVYDIRNMSEPEQRRESSLKYQTRCIRCFPNGAGYALSSIEGRVSIEYFDPSEAVQKKKYAFKCHRRNEGGVDTVYPVNAIAFHPGYGTFATGGCDGTVNVWDGENRKRLTQFSQYPTSIASISFSSDNALVAIASSYTYEEGEKEHPADSIFVRYLTDTDVKPRPKKQA